MERKKFTNALGEDFSYLVHESTKSKLNFVFFHATGFNSETYKIFFEKLKNQFDNQINIYALDQRGHGLSKAKSDHIQIFVKRYVVWKFTYSFFNNTYTFI